MKIVRAERRRNTSGVAVERGCGKRSALGSGWCVTRISYFQKADMFSPRFTESLSPGTRSTSHWMRGLSPARSSQWERLR